MPHLDNLIPAWMAPDSKLRPTPRDRAESTTSRSSGGTSCRSRASSVSSYSTYTSGGRNEAVLRKALGHWLLKQGFVTAHASKVNRRGARTFPLHKAVKKRDL